VLVGPAPEPLITRVRVNLSEIIVVVYGKDGPTATDMVEAPFLVLSAASGAPSAVSVSMPDRVDDNTPSSEVEDEVPLLEPESTAVELPREDCAVLDVPSGDPVDKDPLGAEGDVVTCGAAAVGLGGVGGVVLTGCGVPLVGGAGAGASVTEAACELV